MIPIGDTIRRRTVPYVNYALIVINIAVFIYELSLQGQTWVGSLTQLDHFLTDWGNVPPCTFDALGWDRGFLGSGRTCSTQPYPALTPISAMFMHVGWLHLAGNMLFLWIFGDNVEDEMGHARYAVFYLLVGAIASVAHGVTNIDSLTPAVGASGAVAGVMGAYIVLHPRATVIAIIPPLIFLPLPVPAFIMIGLWFLFELFRGFSSLGPEVGAVGGGVAYFAHIGGFIAGALLIHLFAPRRPKRSVNR